MNAWTNDRSVLVAAIAAAAVASGRIVLGVSRHEVFGSELTLAGLVVVLSILAAVHELRSLARKRMAERMERSRTMHERAAGVSRK